MQHSVCLFSDQSSLFSISWHFSKHGMKSALTENGRILVSLVFSWFSPESLSSPSVVCSSVIMRQWTLRSSSRSEITCRRSFGISRAESASWQPLIRSKINNDDKGSMKIHSSVIFHDCLSADVIPASQPDCVDDLGQPDPRQLCFALPASVKIQLCRWQSGGEESSPNEPHKPIGQLLNHFL